MKKQYQSNEEELIVLIEDKPLGASVIDDYLIRPQVTFLASVNPKTGNISKEKGILEWYIENTPNRKDWGFDFQKLEICHVLVKKCIQTKLEPHQSKITNDSYLLLKVISKNIHNEQLEDISKEYKKVIKIKSEFGNFTLNRQYGWFEGKIDWLGKKYEVSLNVDEENETTANNALNTLYKLLKSPKQCDIKLREFAAKKLIKTCNEWRLDEDSNARKISKQEFSEQIILENIYIDNDGTAQFEFNDNDLFSGHYIVVTIDNRGKLIDAEI